MSFDPDAQQALVLGHDRGALLLTGDPGTGKTAVLRERFARLIDGGADPERVALVVRTRAARAAGRSAVLARMARSLPAVPLLTVHGLAHLVLVSRFQVLGYDHPPELLT